MARVRDILHDHVDVDVRLRHAAEQLRRDPGAIRDFSQRDLGLAHVVRDTANEDVLHIHVYLPNDRSRRFAEA